MKYFVFFISILFLLSSCATRKPFTRSLQKEFELTESDLKKIQFYNSEDIVLIRKDATGSKGTKDGELYLSEEKEENKVIIPAGTKGVLEKVDNSNLIVRFEMGKGNVLRFGVKKGRDAFYLLAKKWNNGYGQMGYGGQTYYCTPGSGDAYLQVVLRKLQKYKSQERVVKGVDVQ